MQIKETRLYLLRHGRLINSDTGALNGKSDTPLSVEGRKEMLLWTKAFMPGFFAVVASSDLQRTAEPANVFADGLKCPLEIYQDLREINAGRWEGKTYTEIMEQENELLTKRMNDPVHVPFPEGENLLALKKRVKRRTDKIINAYEGKNILIISHAGVIRTILLTYLGIPLKNFFKIEVDFGSLSVLRIFEDGNVTLKMVNLNYALDL